MIMKRRGIFVLVGIPYHTRDPTHCRSPFAVLWLCELDNPQLLKAEETSTRDRVPGVPKLLIVTQKDHHTYQTSYYHTPNLEK
jgi:hypothetical protein